MHMWVFKLYLETLILEKLQWRVQNLMIQKKEQTQRFTVLGTA